MTYQSPVPDILFSLEHVAGLDAEISAGLFGDIDWETVASVIGEAGHDGRASSMPTCRRRSAGSPRACPPARDPSARS